MYLEHYGLKEPPFSITPDPRFVFLSERHRDALAHLLFGIDKGGGGGFVQLTGEVGTGKTTLCRLLLEQLPDNARVALVLNPRQSPVELLETICEELHLDIAGARGSVKALVDVLNASLLDAYAQGLRVVLIIDEAQDLSIDALEQVRLLTNLETDTQKLLQVILLGQPELRDLLARDDLRQLAQRITARYHLTPLDAAGTERYLRHRYAIAGGVHLPFTRAAVRRLHARSGGVPRLLNVIAERSLLAGYARDETRLDAGLVELAARETLATRSPRRRWTLPVLATSALALVAMAMLLAWRWPLLAPPVGAAAQAAPMAVAAVPATGTGAGTAPAAVPVTRLPDADALAQRLATTDAAPATAWQPLLSAWQLPTAAADVTIAARCAPLLAPGVHCLRGQGGLDTLTAIGRPALLRLHGGAGGPRWALLRGADALRVRLQLGSERFDIPRVALQRVWSGDYVVLWRAPPALSLPLALDADPRTTTWLRARLHAMTSAPAGADSNAELDVAPAGAPTVADVRRFQAAHGIAADGLIGPQTLLALTARDPGPQLLQTLD